MRHPTRRRLLRAGALVSAAALAGCGARERASALALGDSYTVGSGVSGGERWVDRLPDRLRERGYALDMPAVVAAGGWTTDDLREAIRQRELAVEDEVGEEHAPNDIVTLCIGANDAFQGRSATEFRPRYEGLVERAVRFTGGHPANVLVLTVPDYTLTPVGKRHDPDAHRGRLDAYNDIIEHTAAARGTRLVDLVAPSRRVVEDPDLVAGDGLHPSAKQHGLWLDRIAPVVAEALAE